MRFLGLRYFSDYCKVSRWQAQLIQGKSSQSSFRGRKERSLDSGFGRVGDREEYKGLGKWEDLLEEESSDEDVKRLVMAGIGDLLSEEDEEEDEDYDFLKKKAAPAFGYQVKSSDSYLTKTRASVSSMFC